MNANEDKKILEKAYQIGRKLEALSKDGQFHQEDLAQFTALVSQLNLSEDPHLQKLSLILDHLHPEMTLRHFSNFLIPLERQLSRLVKDDDFLIQNTDRPTRQKETLPLVLILENIRSAFNVGGAFRLSDAVGVSELALCGYTPDKTADSVQKTALGSEVSIPSRHFAHLTEAISYYHSQGYQIIALETAEKSKDLYLPFAKKPTAFVAGNERFGLEASALNLCDEVRSIPMSGLKNSLNVVSSLSIACYEWRRQWKLN